MAGRFTARRQSEPELTAPAEVPIGDGMVGLSWTVVSEPANEPVPAANNPLLTDKLLDAKVRLHRRLIEEIKKGNQISLQLRQIVLPPPPSTAGSVAKKLRLSWARA